MKAKTLTVAASLLAALFVIAGALPTAKAQDQPPPDDSARPERGDRSQRGRMRGPGMMVGRMLEELGLSEEQRTQVDGIMQKQMEEMRTFMEERTGRFFDEVAKVLTEEQRVKLEDIRARLEERRSQRGERGERGERGLRGMRGERMVEEAVRVLALSPEDEQIIAPLVRQTVETQGQQRQQVMERRREFQEFVRGGDANQEELATRLAAYRQAVVDAEAQVKARQEELRSLLTVEQEAKLVALGVLE